MSDCSDSIIPTATGYHFGHFMRWPERAVLYDIDVSDPTSHMLR